MGREIGERFAGPAGSGIGWGGNWAALLKKQTMPEVQIVPAAIVEIKLAA
jgi:hypothetical protein